MIAVERIKIKGHHNIRALHKTTFEVTKDDYVTERGDCIIGIMADKSINDLSDEFKKIAKGDSFIYAVIRVKNLFDVIRGKGSSKFILNDDRKLVFRRSNFVEKSTVMIFADKAAKDINRNIIDYLKQGEEGEVYLLASYNSLKDEEIFRVISNFCPISFA
ncbi:MAG: DUF371 domain-containing protein [Saccharolobus sp.]